MYSGLSGTCPTQELAIKPSAIVILSEAKDLALSIFELPIARFMESSRAFYREQTPKRLERAQSEILRFAQDDSFPSFFREL
jgi:hypothetical protein